MNIRRILPVALAAVLLATVGVGLVSAGLPVQPADLAVSKTDSPDPVVTGQPLTYTVTVVNNGPSSATPTLTDTLPAGTVFVSATPAQGTCAYTLATHSVACPLGSMSNSASVSVTIIVTAGAPGTISNTATVSATTTADLDSANNSDIETTTVVAGPNADLAITKADAPDPVVTGQQVTYTLTARNNGPDAVGGVRIEDSLAASGAAFVSATASQGTCTHSTTTNVVTCAVGIMASGATVTATIIVTSGAPGTSTNTAEIDSTAAAWTDGALGNNTATTQTTVIAASTPTPTPTPAPSAGLLPDTTAAPAPAPGGPAGAAALVLIGSTILLAGAWGFSARRRASRSG